MKKILRKIIRMFNRCATSGLSYAETKNIMKNNQNVVLIDVRSRQEFNEEHLPDAINISVYDISKEIANRVADKSDIIILYCQTEKRSIKAKRILEKIGYVNTYILKGGIDSVVV